MVLRQGPFLFYPFLLFGGSEREMVLMMVTLVGGNGKDKHKDICDQIFEVETEHIGVDDDEDDDDDDDGVLPFLFPLPLCLFSIPFLSSNHVCSVF